MDHRYLRPLIGVQLYLPNYIPKGYNLLLSAETASAVIRYFSPLDKSVWPASFRTNREGKVSKNQVVETEVLFD